MYRLTVFVVLHKKRTQRSLLDEALPIEMRDAEKHMLGNTKQVQSMMDGMDTGTNDRRWWSERIRRGRWWRWQNGNQNVGWKGDNSNTRRGCNGWWLQAGTNLMVIVDNKVATVVMQRSVLVRGELDETLWKKDESHQRVCHLPTRCRRLFTCCREQRLSSRYRFGKVRRSFLRSLRIRMSSRSRFTDDLYAVQNVFLFVEGLEKTDFLAIVIVVDVTKKNWYAMTWREILHLEFWLDCVDRSKIG